MLKSNLDTHELSVEEILDYFEKLKTSNKIDKMSNASNAPSETKPSGHNGKQKRGKDRGDKSHGSRKAKSGFKRKNRVRTAARCTSCPIMNAGI
jgi:hypothetical protein